MFVEKTLLQHLEPFLTSTGRNEKWDVQSKGIPPTGFVWGQSKGRAQTQRLKFLPVGTFFPGKHLLPKILVRGKSSLNELSSSIAGRSVLFLLFLRLFCVLIEWEK